MSIWYMLYHLGDDRFNNLESLIITKKMECTVYFKRNINIKPSVTIIFVLFCFEQELSGDTTVSALRNHYW